MIMSLLSLLLLLCFSLSINVVSGQAEGNEIVIESWTIPSNTQPYETMTAVVGDTVTFKWLGNNHNVYIYPSGSCSNSADAIEVGVSPSPASYTFTQDHYEKSGGSMLFVCTIGQHCSLGMRILFEITPRLEIIDAIPPPGGEITNPPTDTLLSIISNRVDTSSFAELFYNIGTDVSSFLFRDLYGVSISHPYMDTEVESLSTIIGNPKTLLLPNNDAFLSSSWFKDLYALNRWTYIHHVESILRYHIVMEDKYTVNEIFDGQRSTLITAVRDAVSGLIYLDQNETYQSFGGSTPKTAIIESNINAFDGIIHIMDEFIIPPNLYMNILPSLNELNLMQETFFDKLAFTEMANLAIYVGLEDTMDLFLESGMTFLIPTNTSLLSMFNDDDGNLPPLDVILSNDDNKDNMKLRQFVENHLLLRNLYETVILITQARSDYNSRIQRVVESYLGTSIWITKNENGALRFQDADVVDPDHLVRNGVIHGISKPLEPPLLENQIRITDAVTTYDINFFETLLIDYFFQTKEEIVTLFNLSHHSFSIFVPINKDFEYKIDIDFPTFRSRVSDDIWSRHIHDFVYNHISTTTIVSPIDLTDVTMLSGMTYPIETDRHTGSIETIGITPSYVLVDDIIAMDGVLHIIDQVLIPNSLAYTFFEMIEMDIGPTTTSQTTTRTRTSRTTTTSYSQTLKDIIMMSELAEIVEGGPYTFLVPINLNTLENIPTNGQESRRLLGKHLFEGIFFTDGISNLEEIVSINGEVYPIEIQIDPITNEEIIILQGSRVLKGDILSNNGVFHHIDFMIGTAPVGGGSNESNPPIITPPPNTIPTTTPPATPPPATPPPVVPPTISPPVAVNPTPPPIQGDDVPRNDQCNDTIRVQLDTSQTGSTNGASPNIQTTCGSWSDQPGVWYSVVGNGGSYTISACTTNAIQIDFGVFNDCSLKNCNGFAELTFAECSTGDNSVYTWDTINEQTYYIHIRSEDRTTPSDFTLTVTGDRRQQTPPPGVVRPGDGSGSGENLYVNWVLPTDRLEYPLRTAKVGDTVIFNWLSYHNVFIHPSNTCDRTGSIEIGKSSPTSYTFTTDDGSPDGKTISFANHVGTNCENGMLQSFLVYTSRDYSGRDTNYGTIIRRYDTNNLNTFISLIGPYEKSLERLRTLFIPNDDGFETFSNEYSNHIQYYTTEQYKYHLRFFLWWHFLIDKELTIDEIFDGERIELNNMYGTISIDQVTQTINDGRVPRTSFIETNINARSAIVHIINEVLVPPQLTMNMTQNLLQYNKNIDTTTRRLQKDDSSSSSSSSIAFESSKSLPFNFSMMANLAITVGLDEELNKFYDSGITFLVPDNGRFIPQPNTRINIFFRDFDSTIDIDTLFLDENREYARDFIKAHLIYNNYYTDELLSTDGERNTEILVTTLLGTHMWITTNGEQIQFQGIEVVLPDQLSRNGVFHAIAEPLSPPYISNLIISTASTSLRTIDFVGMMSKYGFDSTWNFAKTATSTISVFLPTSPRDDTNSPFDSGTLLDRFLNDETGIWYRHFQDFLLNHVSTPGRKIEDYIAGIEVSNRRRRTESNDRFLQKKPSLNTITMLSGRSYPLQLDSRGNLLIDDASIILGDITALDGYLHLVDKMFIPSSMSHSILDIVDDDSRFHRLVGVIRKADMIVEFDRGSPLTFLAPENQAWQDVSFDESESENILKRHLFPGLFFMDDFMEMTEITSLDGEVHSVEVIGDIILIGGTQITGADALANNGVLHHVDRVIGLDYDRASPNLLPMNKQCTDAFPLEFGKQWNDTTIGATIDEIFVDPPETCRFGLDKASVWYVVYGNEMYYSLSLCTDNNVQTDVYFGVLNDCEGHCDDTAIPLTLTTNPDGLDDFRCATKSYSWLTVKDQPYYIFVQSPLGRATDFTMQVTTIQEKLSQPTSAPSEKPTLGPPTTTVIPSGSMSTTSNNRIQIYAALTISLIMTWSFFLY